MLRLELCVVFLYAFKTWLFTTFLIPGNPFPTSIYALRKDGANVYAN